MSGPRILFLIEEAPLPADQGDRIRAFHLIRELARRHAVTVLAFDSPAAGAASGTLGVELRVVRRPRRPSWLAALRRPLWPLTAARRWSSRMSREVRHLLGSRRFDLVIAYQLKMAPYAACAAGVPRVLDLTDSFTLYLEEYRRFARGWPRRTALGWERWKAARLERRVAGSAELVVVSSEGDRRALHGLGVTTRVEIVPNGCQPADGPSGSPEPGTIVFVGNLAYPPNDDGVRWFAREVLPLVRERVPAARLAIVGKRPTPAVLRLAALPAVEVTGPVADVRPHLDRAAAVINPVRFGSGTRIKLLEAMARGKAVVSTVVGASGIDVRPGEDILLAGDAQGFARGVAALLEDGELRRAVGARARRVAETHAWAKVAAGLEAILPGRVGAAAPAGTAPESRDAHG